MSSRDTALVVKVGRCPDNQVLPVGACPTLPLAHEGQGCAGASLVSPSSIALEGREFVDASLAGLPRRFARKSLQYRTGEQRVRPCFPCKNESSFSCPDLY